MNGREDDKEVARLKGLLAIALVGVRVHRRNILEDVSKHLHVI